MKKYSNYGTTANVQHPQWNAPKNTHRVVFTHEATGFVTFIVEGSLERCEKALPGIVAMYEAMGAVVLEEIRRA